MRPTGLEAIRAVQAALAEVIAPQLNSAFGQDTAQTLQMLLESLAGEWDGAAERLRRDNETLGGLLVASHGVLAGMLGRNERLAAIVTDIEHRLAENVDDSVAVSRLTSRNEALRGTLERILIVFEDLPGEGDYQEIDAVRESIYTHLRDVASRGWSFWDVSSFRGRMAAVHSAAVARDDARGRVDVE